MPSVRRRIVAGNEIPKLVCEHVSGVQEIILCSPFLTMGGIGPLLERFKKKEKFKLDVISRFDEVEWLTGVTDPKVFDELFLLAKAKPERWEVTIWLVESLHTKAIVLGSKAAIIGSANITGGGFETNHEMGILVSGSMVETIKKRILAYKEAGVLFTPEAMTAKMARLEGETGARIKGMIFNARKHFNERRCPGLIEFTRERQVPLDYTEHVFELLKFVGSSSVPTAEIKLWLDHKAVIGDEPKASTKRIYFLESLGLIEEIAPDVWRRTERGKYVLTHRKPALYWRMKSRWKIFGTLEDILRGRYKNKTFNASILSREEEFKRKNVRQYTIANNLNHHLRWLRSLGLIIKVTGNGTKEYLYRLVPGGFQ